jgi:hypothetical protein
VPSSLASKRPSSHIHDGAETLSRFQVRPPGVASTMKGRTTPTGACWAAPTSFSCHLVAQESTISRRRPPRRPVLTWRRASFRALARMQREEQSAIGARTGLTAQHKGDKSCLKWKPRRRGVRANGRRRAAAATAAATQWARAARAAGAHTTLGGGGEAAARPRTVWPCTVWPCTGWPRAPPGQVALSRSRGIPGADEQCDSRRHRRCDPAACTGVPKNQHRTPKGLAAMAARSPRPAEFVSKKPKPPGGFVAYLG